MPRRSYCRQAAAHQIQQHCHVSHDHTNSSFVPLWVDAQAASECCRGDCYCLLCLYATAAAALQLHQLQTLRHAGGCCCAHRCVCTLIAHIRIQPQPCCACLLRLLPHMLVQALEVALLPELRWDVYTLDPPAQWGCTMCFKLVLLHLKSRTCSVHLSQARDDGFVCHI